MRHQNSVFHQLTKQVPWSVFDGAVSRHGSDRRVRRLRTRDQFLALLYGQFSGAASLREIEYGLASQAARLYHAGLRGVSRSTLSDANAKRPFEVYADVFAEMARLARPGLRRKLRGAVRSDAIRLLLLRVADEKRLPFAVQVPNATTVKAMKQLDEGKGKRFSGAEELFEDIGA